MVAAWPRDAPAPEGWAGVKYALGKRAKVFRSAVGFYDHPPDGGPGPTSFIVRGDGKVVWQSRLIVARNEFEECTVDVSGVDILELRTEARGSAFGSHAVWFEPHLLREASAPGRRPELSPGDPTPGR